MEESWDLSEMVMPWTAQVWYPDRREGSFSKLVNFPEVPGMGGLNSVQIACTSCAAGYLSRSLREANRAEVNLLEDPEFWSVLDGQMKKQLEIYTEKKQATLITAEREDSL